MMIEEVPRELYMLAKEKHRLAAPGVSWRLLASPGLSWPLLASSGSGPLVWSNRVYKHVYVYVYVYL